MQDEITAARQKKAVEEAHTAAEAAAHAEEITAATPTMQDSFDAKAVAMKLAVDKVAQEQEATLRAAQGISEEADAARGLGDSAELREEDEVGAHEAMVEEALAWKVAKAKKKILGLERKAGVTSAQLKKSVRVNQAAFSMDALEKADKESAAATRSLAAKVSNMLSPKGHLKGTVNGIKRGLQKQGKALPASGRTQELIKMKVKVRMLEKAARDQAKRANKRVEKMKTAEQDASSFLNSGKASDKKLAAKLSNLEKALAAKGNKVIAQRKASLSKRITKLQTLVTALLAGKQVKREEKAASKGSASLQRMAAQVRDAMRVAGGVEKGPFDDIAHLNGQERQARLLSMKESLASELGALKRKAGLLTAGSKSVQLAARLRAAADLLAKKDRLKAEVRADRRDLKRLARRNIHGITRKGLQKGDKSAVLEESAEEKYDREQLSLQKMHVQFDVLKDTDKRNALIFARAQQSLLEEKKRKDALLLVEKKRRAKLKRDLSTFAEAADGALWQAEEGLKAKESAEEKAEAGKEALEREIQALSLAKEGTADATGARVRCIKLISKMHSKLAKLLLMEKGATRDEKYAAILREKIDKLKAIIAAGSASLLSQETKGMTEKEKLRHKLEHMRKANKARRAKLSQGKAAQMAALMKARGIESAEVRRARRSAQREIEASKVKAEREKRYQTQEVDAAKQKLAAIKESASRAKKAEAKRAAKSKKKLSKQMAGKMAGAEKLSAKENDALVKKVVAAKKRAHQIAEQAKKVAASSLQKADQRISLARARSLAAENKASETCMLQQNTLERQLSAELNTAKAKRLRAEEGMAATKMRDARIVKVAQKSDAKAAKKTINKLAKTAQSEEKVAFSIGAKQDEKEARAEQRKIDLSEELAREKVKSSILAGQINKYKQLTKLDQQEEVQLQASLSSIKISNLKKRQDSEAMEKTASKARAAMLRGEVEEDDAIKKKGGLSAKKDIAAAKNHDATGKLEWLRKQNAAMRQRIAMLLRTKNGVVKEKRTYLARKVKAELKTTLAGITTEQSKLAILKAQKKLAGEREDKQEGQTQALLKKVKQEEARLKKPLASP